jgi:hypothetical protein
MSSKRALAIPVLPKLGAFSYLDGGEDDHNAARLLNSNFVAKRTIPKNFNISLFVVAILLFSLN